MISQLLRKKKELHFERSYPATAEAVWVAWTDANQLRAWWGPDKTTVPECQVDLKVGGRIYIVIEAGEEMGKYQGTRWPMEGTFTRIVDHQRLTYDDPGPRAKSRQPRSATPTTSPSPTSAARRR
jgi:uncharacterized protein YndB with AHSA1/START domain